MFSYQMKIFGILSVISLFTAKWKKKPWVNIYVCANTITFAQSRIKWGLILTWSITSSDVVNLQVFLSQWQVKFRALKDQFMFISKGYLFKIWGCPRGVMVKAMNCRIVVREFVLQSRYYVHFRANTLGKGMNPLILPPTMGK